MSTIETYRGRLAAAAERDGPDRAAVAAVLAGELRAAHAVALAQRDAAAASLYQHHGWTLSRICTEIHGRPSKVAFVRAAVDAAGRQRRRKEDVTAGEFATATAETGELWDLYKEANKLVEATSAAAAAEPVDPGELNLPTDPMERAKAAAAMLGEVLTELDQVTTHRNRGAAALVVHAGWKKRNAANVAGMAVRDIYPLETSVRPEEADPAALVRDAAEVRRLTARRRAVIAARDAAIRDLNGKIGPVELGKLIDRTDERVTQIRR